MHPPSSALEITKCGYYAQILCVVMECPDRMPFLSRRERHFISHHQFGSKAFAVALEDPEEVGTLKGC